MFECSIEWKKHFIAPNKSSIIRDGIHKCFGSYFAANKLNWECFDSHMNSLNLWDLTKRYIVALYLYYEDGACITVSFTAFFNTCSNQQISHLKMKKCKKSWTLFKEKQEQAVNLPGWLMDAAVNYEWKLIDTQFIFDVGVQ